MVVEKGLRFWGCFHFASHLFAKVGFERDHFVGVLVVADRAAVDFVAVLRLRDVADRCDYLVAVFSFSEQLYRVT